MFFGFIVVSFERQRRYIAALTPILLAGLYQDDLKKLIGYFFTNYWFVLIPLGVFFVCLDMFVLLPGEQLFYSKSNKVLMDVYNNTEDTKKIH